MRKKIIRHQRKILRVVIFLLAVFIGASTVLGSLNLTLSQSNRVLRRQNLKLSLDRAKETQNKGSIDLDQYYFHLPISRTINNITYHISDKAISTFNTSYLPIFQIEDPEQKSIIDPNTAHILRSLVSRNTVDFWIDEENQRFFYSEFLPGPEGPGFQTFNQVDFENNFLKPIQLDLITVETLPHYSRTKIVNYYPQQQIFLLITQGGDGCGGQGEIWTVSLSGNRKSLGKFGIGCVTDKLRFGGFIKEKPVFSEVTPLKGEVGSGELYAKINNLYVVDPLNSQREYLDISSINSPVDLLTDLGDLNKQEYFFNNTSILLEKDMGEGNYSALHEFDVETQEFTPFRTK